MSCDRHKGLVSDCASCQDNLTRCHEAFRAACTEYDRTHGPGAAARLIMETADVLEWDYQIERNV